MGGLWSLPDALRCRRTTFHRITRLIPVAKIAIPRLVQVQGTEPTIMKFDQTATTAIATSRNPTRNFHLSIPESKRRAVGGPLAERFPDSLRGHALREHQVQGKQQNPGREQQNAETSSDGLHGLYLPLRFILLR